MAKQKQFPVGLNNEDKILLESASKIKRLSVGSFIRSISIQEARKIIKENSEAVA